MNDKNKDELQEELEEAKERIYYLKTRLKHAESHSKRLYSELQRRGFRRVKGD